MMHTKLTNESGRYRVLRLLPAVLLMALGTANAQVPPNDNCDAATVIPSSAPDPVFTDMVVTTDATNDPADPALSCNFQQPGFPLDGENTVWYEWTPAASGEVNISTFISSTLPDADEIFELDTAHGLFIGSCDALVEVACVDLGLNDELIVEVDAGVTYRIKVGEFANGLAHPNGPLAGGNLSLTVKPAPSFPQQFIIESSRHGVSPRMRDIVGAVATTLSSADAGNIAERATEIPNMMGEDVMKSQPAASSGPSLGSMVAGNGKKKRFRGSPKVKQIFEGGENDDNANLLQILIAPPDTIGDVGRRHYVQMYNLLTEIFDKRGNTVLGPFATNTFFTGLGGQCEFTNSGDPIVLYDEQRNRWLVSQFAAGFPQDGLCIAISKTGDPTGKYFQYEFDFTGIGFPDYPKFGFVDGAISVMANMFSPFGGAGLGVIDKKEAMRLGPATMVFFILGPAEFGFIPGDNDGPSFRNVPPTFFTNNFFSGNAIDVWEIDPDFRYPENTTIAEVASIDVSPFDTDLCDAPRETCIAQPGSGTGDFPDDITFLEAISDRMMHRAQMRAYRSGHDGHRKNRKNRKNRTDIRAIMSHTVDADGDGTAGVRWYEMRNKKDRGWKLKKENTFSPDNDHRWMGSIAMTKKGQTCLGYSISSENTFPSIGVTGRKGRGNHMNVKEAVVFDGNAAGNVQRQTGRWGDYSSMNIDPVDDSCWYTTEYAKPNSFIGERFGWGTKIVQFKLSGGGHDDDDDDDDDDD